MTGFVFEQVLAGEEDILAIRVSDCKLYRIFAACLTTLPKY